MEIKYKLEKMNSASEKILYYFSACVAGVVGAAYSAFVFTKIWKYIVEPVFQVEPISIGAALGILFLVGYLTNRKSPVAEVVIKYFNSLNREISHWESLVTLTFGSIFYNSCMFLISFVIGYLIK